MSARYKLGLRALASQKVLIAMTVVMIFTILRVEIIQKRKIYLCTLDFRCPGPDQGDRDCFKVAEGWACYSFHDAGF